ncbi:hypothetical protein MMC21_003812 [Puttea exsequens]|nr:hypothetical protein [Puttea exsequens]
MNSGNLCHQSGLQTEGFFLPPKTADRIRVHERAEDGPYTGWAGQPTGYGYEARKTVDDLDGEIASYPEPNRRTHTHFSYQDLSYHGDVSIATSWAGRCGHGSAARPNGARRGTDCLRGIQPPGLHPLLDQRPRPETSPVKEARRRCSPRLAAGDPRPVCRPTAAEFDDCQPRRPPLPLRRQIPHVQHYFAGIACNACLKIYLHVDLMQEHCKLEHGWTLGRRPGAAPAARGGAEHVADRVVCQRLLVHTAGLATTLSPYPRTTELYHLLQPFLLFMRALYPPDLSDGRRAVGVAVAESDGLSWLAGKDLRH